MIFFKDNGYSAYYVENKYCQWLNHSYPQIIQQDTFSLIFLQVQQLQSSHCRCQFTTQNETNVYPSTVYHLYHYQQTI